jgi:hypothetical protein
MMIRHCQSLVTEMSKVLPNNIAVCVLSINVIMIKAPISILRTYLFVLRIRRVVGNPNIYLGRI